MSPGVWAFGPSEQSQTCLLCHLGCPLTFAPMSGPVVSPPSIQGVDVELHPLRSTAELAQNSPLPHRPPAQLAFLPSIQAHPKAAPPHTSSAQLTHGDLYVAAPSHLLLPLSDVVSSPVKW